MSNPIKPGTKFSSRPSESGATWVARKCKPFQSAGHTYNWKAEPDGRSGSSWSPSAFNLPVLVGGKSVKIDHIYTI